MIDTARGAADVLGVAWDNHTAAHDAVRTLQEIAAAELGGAPDDYRVTDGRVFHAVSPSRGLTPAQAATLAIARRGKYDGHERPADIHVMTRASATALAGLGLMGVAKHVYPHDGDTHSCVMGFAEVEVDVETGALARRFHHNKPLIIMDVPPGGLHHAALDLADLDTPVGARGVGEPPVGAVFGAVLAAIADAVGAHVSRRASVTPDIVLTALEVGRHAVDVLASHV